MAMEIPLVTVLLPVYNRPGIIDTLNSIINQTYNNLEILVIDNASTDNTVKIIQSIEDDRIRLLINEENKGQTFSLNRGLKEAKGKYIARIDSDDIALPERIEKQVAFMESHPDYVLIGSWVRFISDSNELGMVVRMPTSDEGMRLMQTVACGMYHPSAMYRRKIITEYNLTYDPDIHMAEDYDLWVKLMKYGKACNLAEPLIFYRRGNHNDSRHHHDLMGKESTEIRKRVCKELSKDIINEIKLEEKENKTLLECFRVFRFYQQYLRKNMSVSSVDYNILKLHFAIKTYGSCFISNNRWYAEAIRNIYKILRELKNRNGGRQM